MPGKMAGGGGSGSPSTIQRRDQRRARAAERRTLEVMASARRAPTPRANAAHGAAVFEKSTGGVDAEPAAGGAHRSNDSAGSSSPAGTSTPPREGKPPPPPAVAVAAAARLSLSASSSSNGGHADHEETVRELEARLRARAKEAKGLREHASVASDLEAEVHRVHSLLEKTRREAADDAEAWDERRLEMDAETSGLRARLARTVAELAASEAVAAAMRDRAEEATVAAAEAAKETTAGRERLTRVVARAESAEARVNELDAQIARLEAENAALLKKGRHVDLGVEAEVAAAAEAAAEEAVEGAQAAFERRLRDAAAELQEERALRRAAERRAHEACASAGVGRHERRARAEAVAEAVAVAVAAERARSAELLRDAALTAVDTSTRRADFGAFSAVGAVGAEATLMGSALMGELLADVAELDAATRRFHAAAAEATEDVDAYAERAGSGECLRDVGDRDVPRADDDGSRAVPPSTRRSPRLGPPHCIPAALRRMTERRVSPGEETAAARAALGAIPAFATLLAADPRRAAALAAACRVRSHTPGEVILTTHYPRVDNERRAGRDDLDRPGGGEGEELIVVASGTLEVRSSSLNPFLAGPAATYAALPGDAIGEVAAAVDVLRVYRRRCGQAPAGGTTVPSLPPRAPATAICSSGPCRLFVLSSRDLHDVLLVAHPGRDPEAQTSSGLARTSPASATEASAAAETARRLVEAVSMRLAELKAAALTSATDGANVASDLNAPTTVRSADHPLGVRWSARQLAAAGSVAVADQSGVGGTEGGTRESSNARGIIRRAVAALRSAALSAGRRAERMVTAVGVTPGPTLQDVAMARTETGRAQPQSRQPPRPPLGHTPGSFVGTDAGNHRVHQLGGVAQSAPRGRRHPLSSRRDQVSWTRSSASVGRQINGGGGGLDALIQDAEEVSRAEETVERGRAENVRVSSTSSLPGTLAFEGMSKGLFSC